MEKTGRLWKGLGFAVLWAVAGSRIEIALQQSDAVPKICVAQASYYVDSQVATAEQYQSAARKKGG